MLHDSSYRQKVAGDINSLNLLVDQQLGSSDHRTEIKYIIVNANIAAGFQKDPIQLTLKGSITLKVVCYCRQGLF